MKPTPHLLQQTDHTGLRPRMYCVNMCIMATALLATPAQASMFKGEALDNIADVMAWVVLVITPLIGISVFWLVHILPEKIAEKKKHPQAKAIQVLCLLSLAFGGLLWPLAWLWAYTKPVLHKLAYGTDVAEEHEHNKKELKTTESELDLLRAKVAEIEMKLAGQPASLSPNSLPEGERDEGSLREFHVKGDKA
ncbi:MAG: DUF3302 domain-containing protein [Sulfuricellaceae bacterium]|nr:DUF3302 domain-containing protein [Sulfuricellaceae bacterium]